MVASADHTDFNLIHKLRSWFFAMDRDIQLATGRQLVTQDGTNVEDALEAEFVTLAVDGDLDNERVLTAGTGISIVDGGAGSTVTINATGAAIPSGGVIFWPSTAGAIPSGWSTFAAGSGKFLVGTDGGTFTNGSTGGAETIDIQHSHTSGSLATDNDTHGHSSGSLATDNDTHDHSFSDTSSTPSATFTDDRHFTGSTTYPTGNHTHGVSGTTGTDQHNHSVTSGSTATDQHGHSVTTGSTANALSTAQSILPVYLVGTWISKD